MIGSQPAEGYNVYIIHKSVAKTSKINVPFGRGTNELKKMTRRTPDTKSVTIKRYINIII